MRRARFRLAILSGATLFSSCTYEAIEISLPELREGRAAAVAFESGPMSGIDHLVSVSLFDRSARENLGLLPFDPEFSLDGDGRISLFEYEDGLGLEDLGYESGPLARGADFRLDSFPVSIRELSIDDGQPGAWRDRTLADLDGPLSDFRFADRQPNCACLTGKIIEVVTSTSSTVLLARLGPRRVIVGTEDGLLFWVHADDFEPIPLNGLRPFDHDDNNGYAVGGGIAIGPDRLVVADFRGIFWLYEIDDAVGLVRVTELGRWVQESRARWLSYVPPRIYGLDLHGVFGWIDIESGEARELHRFDLIPGAYQHGVVAKSASSDEVVAGSVHSTELIRFSNEQVRVDVGFEQLESLGAATFHPELGWFLGTTTNGFVHHERSDRSWKTCESQLGNSIGALVPFRDGFLAGSTQGFLEQYSARDGWCEKLQPISNTVRFMTPYDDDEKSFVVTGPKVEERNQRYSTVTVLSVSPQGECDLIRNPGRDPHPTCSLDAQR